MLHKFLNLGTKGAWLKSRELLLFGTASISLEWRKLETSNLVPKLIARNTIEKNAKLGQIGTQPTSRDLLLNYGTASISLERLKLETSNLVCKLDTRSSIQKMQN